ncbi:MAG: arylsulfatase [Cyclobacteriaceae bacterium]
MKPIIYLTILLLINSCSNNRLENNQIKTSARKPSIIYILADDLGYGDVSYNGQKKFQTPNIDFLAKNGLVFTQHYSGSSVCAPSRSTLLTGMHTGHTAIRGNKEIFPEGQYPLPNSTYTLAELLKEQGYLTSAYGKWGLGFPGSEGDPNSQGFDEFYGYNCQRLAHHYYPYHLWHNQEKVLLEGNKGTQTGQYAPKLIHEEALSFLEKNKDTSFFMYYASALPHAELLIDDDEVQAFRGKFLPEKSFEGVDEGDTFRKGPYGSQKEGHAAFAAMVTMLDRQVGELVAKLEELKILDNTLIMFTSDNGPHSEGGADPVLFNSNGPYKGLKRDLYEGGIHVPMVAYWKGKIKKGQTDHISAFWDVLPTLADLTGAQSPENIDGVSFLPTLLNREGQKEHEYLYWEFHEKGGRLAIRKGKWKGVKYNITTAKAKSLELYDLESDPGEEHDLAFEYPEVIEELDSLLTQGRIESPVFKFQSATYLDHQIIK